MSSADIFKSHNRGLDACEQLYTELWSNIAESQKQTLVFHVFAGHAVLQDGMQALLINQSDDHKSFYERFAAEKYVKRTAEKCANAYNVAVFSCCR